MAPLRFRAWHKKVQKMALFHDPHIYTNSPATHLCFDLTGWEATEERIESENYTQVLDCYGEEFAENIVLMQSTGLHDKNGKEIFEGDIVHYVYLPGPDMWNNDCIATIEWESTGFHLTSRSAKVGGLLQGWLVSIPGGGEPNCRKVFEVIGNVWETPSLLHQ